ncbi:MAG: alpha/beta fold hydrolase [Mycobacteriaceae bacterium]|nr:alpha/beta fold hydrolase [Mycobacteriaceae bacterium]
MTARGVVLLHGTPLSPEVWDGVRAELSVPSSAPDLNGLIDQAGHGCLQTEVAAQVLDGLPDGEMVVVGHSFGGQIAIELALLAPHRLAHLVVVCSRHTPFPAFARGAQTVRAGRPPDIDAGLHRWFTASELAADGTAVKYARRQLHTAALGPWAAALDAIATYDRADAVSGIEVPSLLLAGGIDEVASPAVMARLAADLPHGRLEVVAAWAHMSPFAEPGAFAARLRTALRFPT